MEEYLSKEMGLELDKGSELSSRAAGSKFFTASPWGAAGWYSTHILVLEDLTLRHNRFYNEEGKFLSLPTSKLIFTLNGGPLLETFKVSLGRGLGAAQIFHALIAIMTFWEILWLT